MICKLRQFLPRHTLLTIYRSLVTPYLTYGLIAWGQACKSYLEKLLKLQKRALRFIYFPERNQHAIPLFIDAGVLPLKSLCYELLAHLVFEIRHRNAPGNILALFQDISDIHSYNTRSSASNNFYTQSSRLSIEVDSFSMITNYFSSITSHRFPRICEVFVRKYFSRFFDVFWKCYSEKTTTVSKRLFGCDRMTCAVKHLSGVR